MLRIRDWNKHFETAQTRPYKLLRWVPIPNKHDGDGFTQLIEHDHGVMHYGAWTLLVQLASKCNPRGTLVRDGNIPHTAESLGRILRVAAGVFREAIPRFIQIGWLEDVPADSVPIACYSDSEKSPPRTERNGTEKNGTFRSFVCASDQTEVWEAARSRAKEIKRALWPSRMSPLTDRDRDMLLKVAYLSKTTLTDEWLGDGIEGTRLKSAKKPAAYLKTVLAETARRIGHNLNELLDAIEIPPKPAPAAGTKPDLGLEHVGEMPEAAP
jgi:hypothetical protein